MQRRSLGQIEVSCGKASKCLTHAKPETVLTKGPPKSGLECQIAAFGQSVKVVDDEGVQELLDFASGLGGGLELGNARPIGGEQRGEEFTSLGGQARVVEIGGQTEVVEMFELEGEDQSG